MRLTQRESSKKFKGHSFILYVKIVIMFGSKRLKFSNEYTAIFHSDRNELLIVNKKESPDLKFAKYSVKANSEVISLFEQLLGDRFKSEEINNPAEKTELFNLILYLKKEKVLVSDG